MTDLQTELATLIADLVPGGMYDDNDNEIDLASLIAARLAAAFQQVAWRNDVGSFIDCEWAERRGLAAMYDGPCPDWEPIYRFVRPESVEPRSPVDVVHAYYDQRSMLLPCCNVPIYTAQGRMALTEEAIVTCPGVRPESVEPKESNE